LKAVARDEDVGCCPSYDGGEHPQEQRRLIRADGYEKGSVFRCNPLTSGVNWSAEKGDFIDIADGMPAVTSRVLFLFPLEGGRRKESRTVG
jgi:hypothetical protein